MLNDLGKRLIKRFSALEMSVTLHTTAGDIKIELFCEKCPKTCEVSFSHFIVLSI